MASGFDAVLQRMFERRGADTLATHLETVRGLPVARLSQLDVRVFRVDRRDRGRPLVARLFPATRPLAGAEGDLAVLRYLADIGFPAERPFGEPALSRHDGQAVLLTESSRRPPEPSAPRTRSSGWAR